MYSNIATKSTQSLTENCQLEPASNNLLAWQDSALDYRLGSGMQYQTLISGDFMAPGGSDAKQLLTHSEVLILD